MRDCVMRDLCMIYAADDGQKSWKCGKMCEIKNHLQISLEKYIYSERKDLHFFRKYILS